MQTVGKEEMGGGGEGGAGRVALESLLRDHAPPDAPTAKGTSVASPTSSPADGKFLEDRQKRKKERRRGAGYKV